MKAVKEGPCLGVTQQFSSVADTVISEEAERFKSDPQRRN